MPDDPVTQATREWLERLVGRYAGIDAGEGDPVHAVRVRAKERLDAGSRPSDPWEVCAMLADALPGDERAVQAQIDWCDTYLRVLGKL